MQWRTGAIAGAGAVALVLLTRVATADPVRMWHDPTRQLGGRSGEVIMVPSGEELPGTGITIPPIEANVRVPVDVPFNVADLLLFLVFIVVVAAVLLWRHLRDIDAEPFDTLPDIPATLADVVTGLEHAVASGTPRDAIVACWVNLELRVARTGLQRDRAETSTEFTERVLVTYTVDHRAIRTLAGLYREARFSTHELTERHRTVAAAALAELRAQLQRPTRAAEVVSG